MVAAARERTEQRLEAARLRRVVLHPRGKRRHELLHRSDGLILIEPDLIAELLDRRAALRVENRLEKVHGRAPYAAGILSTCPGLILSGSLSVSLLALKIFM